MRFEMVPDVVGIAERLTESPICCREGLDIEKRDYVPIVQAEGFIRVPRKLDESRHRRQSQRILARSESAITTTNTTESRQ